MSSSQNKKDEIFFFDTMWKGEKYEDEPEESYQKTFRLLKLDQPHEGSMSVVDAGCGSGAWGIRLAKRGYVVIGIDISRKLIKMARKLSKTENANFSPVLGDIEYLPFKSEIFDQCLCGGVLHHFRSRSLKLVVKELSRIVKKNGKIFIIEPNGTNPINALGRRLVLFFPGKWVMLRGMATPNERLHTIKSYVKVLKSNDFTEYSCYVVMVRPSSDSCVIHKGEFLQISKNPLKCLVTVREILFDLSWRVLPRVFGGTEILIEATKF